MQILVDVLLWIYGIRSWVFSFRASRLEKSAQEACMDSRFRLTQSWDLELHGVFKFAFPTIRGLNNCTHSPLYRVCFCSSIVYPDTLFYRLWTPRVEDAI